MARGLFITGTGTDVGKTYVTGLIVKKLADCGENALYYKAAMSGNVRDKGGKLIPGDALMVKRTSGISQLLESMCPYVYENAVSPHLASRIEGNPVELHRVQAGFTSLCSENSYITMEGSGGIMCPLCFDETRLWLEDIITSIGLPCLIIADAGLGTINSVVLTCHYMRAKGIDVKGIIFNHFHPGNVMEEDNLKMCECMTGLDVIACVKDGDTEIEIDIDKLRKIYMEVE